MLYMDKSKAMAGSFTLFLHAATESGNEAFYEVRFKIMRIQNKAPQLQIEDQDLTIDQMEQVE